MGIRFSRILPAWVCLAGLSLLLSAAGTARSEEQMKIIFDTDLAGDIDDAFAHALVQISPEFDVLGITTAHGPTDLRAKVSCRMLYQCAQEHIPVAVGRPTGEGKCGDAKRPPGTLRRGARYDAERRNEVY